MRTLVVDGFPAQQGESTIAAVHDVLMSRGDEVESLTLRDSGFTSFMSEAERRAYHDEGDNLITEAQRSSVALVRSVDAIVVCCPIVVGTVPTMVKSWFERTFVPGVAFAVTESGRIRPAMTNLRRVAMLTECPSAGDRILHGRKGCGRATLRALRLTASRRCRSSYGSVTPGSDARSEVDRLVKRWPASS